MKIQIKSIAGSVLFEGDFSCISGAVKAAVKSSADLSYANLSSIKSDFWNVLTYARNEVAGLRLALIEGRVNGSSYTGECACLVGTIANTRHCSYDGLGALKPDSGRPAERFFIGIATGDTPAKSQFAALAVEWIDEWAALLGFDVKPAAAKPAATAEIAP